jgi:hypothetical protein
VITASIFREVVCITKWTDFIWQKRGSSSWLLWIRQWTFELHRRSRLLISHEEICSLGSVTFNSENQTWLSITFAFSKISTVLRNTEITEWHQHHPHTFVLKGNPSWLSRRCSSSDKYYFTRNFLFSLSCDKHCRNKTDKTQRNRRCVVSSLWDRLYEPKIHPKFLWNGRSKLPIYMPKFHILMKTGSRKQVMSCL